MPALVLDAEALSALTAGGDPRRRDVVRAALRSAASNGFVVRVPSVVIAEVSRTAAHQTQAEEAMARFGLQSANLGPATAKRAGRMLGRDGLDSCSLADACVVATAVRFGGGVVVTGDPADLESLAADDANVKILPLQSAAEPPMSEASPEATQVLLVAAEHARHVAGATHRPL